MSERQEPRTQQDNPIRCTIAIEPTGDEWKAYEPASESELYGIGETPPEAVANYALALKFNRHNADVEEYQFPSLDELEGTEA